jgi:hypothetical protein
MSCSGGKVCQRKRVKNRKFSRSAVNIIKLFTGLKLNHYAFLCFFSTFSFSRKVSERKSEIYETKKVQKSFLVISTMENAKTRKKFRTYCELGWEFILTWIYEYLNIHLLRLGSEKIWVFIIQLWSSLWRRQEEREQRRHVFCGWVDFANCSMSYRVDL